MKKIKGALILSAVLCMLPCAANAAEIKLGDYLQMGMIYDEPILWRCVGFEKISGYDNNNPIIDSYDTSREYKDVRITKSGRYSRRFRKQSSRGRTNKA